MAKIKSKMFSISTDAQIEKMESFIDSLGNRYIDDVVVNNKVKVRYYV